MEHLKSKKLYFIIGSGRSGTTLLQYILNNHKNCICSPETKHLLFFYKKYRHVTCVSEDLLDDVNKYFSQRIKSGSLKNYESSPFLLKLGEKITYIELGQRLYYITSNYTSEKKELSTIIDKNPSYTLHVNTLIEMLPDAKFLCLVRDYRGFVLSNMQRREEIIRVPVQYHSIAWRFYYKLIIDIETQHKDRVQILNYENLVTNKEQALAEICTFFNIEYDENCFNYQEKIDLNNKTVQKDKHKLIKLTALSKPIHTERTETWKNTFSTFQLKIIEFWCGSLGEKFGYKRQKNISLIDSILILLISSPYYLFIYTYFKIKPIKLKFYIQKIIKGFFVK